MRQESMNTSGLAEWRKFSPAIAAAVFPLFRGEADAHPD